MQEHKSKKIKRIVEVSILVIACGIILYMLFASFILPDSKYKTANETFDAGNYEEAYKLFGELGKKEEFSEKIDAKVNACMDAGEYLEAFELLYISWTNGWYISKVENEDPSDSMRYIRAMMLIDSGNYELAEQWLLAIQGSESERIRELLKHIMITKDYEKARSLIDQGDYETAYRLLSGLNHKDSADLLKQITPDYRKSLLSKADTNIGSVITFGSYEQDGDEGNGSEPLEWMVIEKDGSKLLVLSLNVLDDMQYISDTDLQFKVEEGQHVTWGNSTIRNWLNDTFFNSSFTPVEQDLIRVTRVTADKNPEYNTDPGIDTMDHVFLLSVDEAMYYICSLEGKTQECNQVGYGEVYKASWWLRTPGARSEIGDKAVYIDGSGNIILSGIAVEYDYFDGLHIGVRPAMWIDLSE